MATISVKVSLSESIYYFTKPNPPKLALTIESYADRPLTLFTWNTPFDPKGGLVHCTSNKAVFPSQIPQIIKPFLKHLYESNAAVLFLVLEDPVTKASKPFRFSRCNISFNPSLLSPTNLHKAAASSRLLIPKCLAKPAILL